MVLLAECAAAVFSVSDARVCPYDFSNSSCPADRTEQYAISNWGEWRARCEIGFGLTGNVTLSFCIIGDIPEHSPIVLYGGSHSLSFLGVVLWLGGIRTVYLDFRNSRCLELPLRLLVPGTDRVTFDNLILEHSTFVEQPDRV
jgi:hypothetical protein